MITEYQTRFGGIERLFGTAEIERLRLAHVCVIGLGGVGSWTAEALARSGIGALTLIDMDEVCLSNVNRQLPALTETVGKTKVSVLRERIRGINPECKVTAVEEFFTSVTADQLLDPSFSYVVDAIDSLANKALLIARCRAQNVPLITLGGAGGRRAPEKIRIADLALASHDPLLRSVRKLLRSDYGFPTDASALFGVPSVFSSERPVFPQPDGTVCEERNASGELRMNCNSGFGSATFVTGTFGFFAAAHVVSQLAGASAAQKRDFPAKRLAKQQTPSI
jgi:tRNA A37 threonylcarbamoyladenosine dehydratase